MPRERHSGMVWRNAGIGYRASAQRGSFDIAEFSAAGRCVGEQALLETGHHRAADRHYAARHDSCLGPAGIRVRSGYEVPGFLSCALRSFAVSRAVRHGSAVASSNELHTGGGSRFADVLHTFGVFFGCLQMLEHKRNFARELCHLGEIAGVVHFSAPRDYFDKMDVQLRLPAQVFGMTGDYPATQLREAFTDKSGVLIEAAGRVDAVADIHVNAK